MAAVTITLNQTGKPAGVAGRAREDLATGVAVTAAANVDPSYSAYQWSFDAKAIDPLTMLEATSVLATATASSTSISPIDRPGTYKLRLLVDSGSGLGATPDDVATITFYAGVAGSLLNGPLNADPAELPRRYPAFSEQLEHNVPDAISPSGNLQGWAREWLRLFAAYMRMYVGKSWAFGRVALAGSASLVNGLNASVSRTGVGQVHVTFTRSLATANYSVVATARGVPGSVMVKNEATNGFDVERTDYGGALVDADFNFDVRQAVT